MREEKILTRYYFGCFVMDNIWFPPRYSSYDTGCICAHILVP